MLVPAPMSESATGCRCSITRNACRAAANHRVVERGHTVLLNWSERTLPILRQIAESRGSGYKALPVVILADRDVADMREVGGASLVQ